MATLKKKNKGENDGKETFNPLAPGYETKGEFRQALKRRTQGQVQPQLQALRQQNRRERRTSRGRQKVIRQDYRWLGNQYQRQANKSQQILDAGDAARADANQTAQQNLLEALASSQGTDANLATLMGSTGAPDTTDQFGSVISASQGAGHAGNALSKILDSQAMAEQGRVSQARLGGVTQRNAERARRDSALGELKDKRLALIQSIPAIKEEMRKQMIDEEIAKRSEQAREQIAAKSVKLDWAKLRQQGDQFDDQMALEWAKFAQSGRQFNKTLKLQRGQLKQDIVNATNENEKKAAEQAMDNYNNATKAAASWLDAQKYDKHPKRVNPAGLYRLMAGYGLSRSQIIQFIKGLGGPMALWVKNRRLAHDPNGDSLGR